MGNDWGVMENHMEVMIPLSLYILYHVTKFPVSIHGERDSSTGILKKWGVKDIRW